MKKISVLLIAFLLLCVGCSCGAAQATDSADIPIKQEEIVLEPTETGEVIEIRERLFIAQTNDIYINPGDYIGKTIKYEGIFDCEYWEASGENIYYVFRYGPGCCGYDANAGFEVIYGGEYPKKNDWVEAVGVLEEYEEGGVRYLRLNLLSLTVLEKRGKEYVGT